MSNRIYPIRLTRNSWNIPIYSYSIDCNQSNNVEENIDIKRDKINIFHYNQYEPNTINGLLYNKDSIVIPDNKFHMIINFPLTRPADVEVNSKIMRNSNGISLKELIFCIQETYKCIYADEERTASIIRYTAKKRCDNCDINDIKSKVKLLTNENRGKCVCCMEDIENTEIAELDCKHVFHLECIYNWINKDKNNCPICRSNIYNCSKCKGKIYKNIVREDTVIPIEYRENELRNTTDGIYGIYGYDLDKLYLDNLFYNRIEKKLYMNIFNE